MTVPHFHDRFLRPLAIVLGTNDIASAVAIYLHRARRAVVLAHDPYPPVIRRATAFHDVLHGEEKSIEDVRAKRIDRIAEAAVTLAELRQVAVTPMGLTDLLMLGTIDIIVDARMQKHTIRPDLRGLARMVIGLGPGYAVRKNCDLAVETKPLLIGALAEGGTTEPADRTPETIAGVGRERFVYSALDGHWRTPFEIGGRVYKGMPIGHIDRERIYAPIDGVLRGIARDDIDIPKGVKLIEVDPRIYRRRQNEIEARPRLIAEATLRAVRILEAHHKLATTVPGMSLN